MCYKMAPNCLSIKIYKISGVFSRFYGRIAKTDKTIGSRFGGYPGSSVHEDTSPIIAHSTCVIDDYLMTHRKS